MIRLTLVVCFHFIASLCWAQQMVKQADSLKNILRQQTKQDSNRVLTLINYIKVLFFVQTDNDMLGYADECLQISEKIKWQKGIAIGWKAKGMVYHYFLADPVQALNAYQKALQANEKAGNEEFQWGMLANIAIIHFDLKQFEQALKYYNQAYAILRKSEVKNGEDQLLMNMGHVYAGLKMDNKAEDFYKKSMALAEKAGNVQIRSNVLCSLGLLYRNRGNLTEAKYNLEKGLKLAEDNGIVIIQVTGFINLALTYADLKNYTAAKKYGLQALNLAQRTNMRNFEATSLEALAEISGANGDIKAALDYYTAYLPLHDSLLNDEKKQEITRQEMQYVYNKKEDSIRVVQEKQRILNTSEIKRERIVKNTAMGGAGALLLAGITSFAFYKRRRDAEDQKHEAEFKVLVADTEMKALRAQMNPHFIFNSLNSISDYMLKNDIKAADYYLTKFAKVMRMILESSEHKRVSLGEDLKALELYIQLEALRLNNMFTYEIIVDGNIDIENTLIPPLILQPFVENSIWHGFAKKEGEGKILIHIKKDHEMLCCVVEDNGIGRKNKALLSSIENIVEKKSLGMKITKARIDIINKLKKSNAGVVASDLAEGMKVEVRLPLELSF